MYKMQMQTMISGLAWEYNFDSASDQMAIECCKKWLAVPGNVPGICLDVLLWRMADQKLLVQLRPERVVNVREIAQR